MWPSKDDPALEPSDENVQSHGVELRRGGSIYTCRHCGKTLYKQPGHEGRYQWTDQPDGTDALGSGSECPRNERGHVAVRRVVHRGPWRVTLNENDHILAIEAWVEPEDEDSGIYYGMSRPKVYWCPVGEHRITPITDGQVLLCIDHGCGVEWDD